MHTQILVIAQLYHFVAVLRYHNRIMIVFVEQVHFCKVKITTVEYAHTENLELVEGFYCMSVINNAFPLIVSSGLSKPTVAIEEYVNYVVVYLTPCVSLQARTPRQWDARWMVLSTVLT